MGSSHGLVLLDAANGDVAQLVVQWAVNLPAIRLAPAIQRVGHLARCREGRVRMAAAPGTSCRLPGSSVGSVEQASSRNVPPCAAVHRRGGLPWALSHAPDSPVRCRPRNLQEIRARETDRGKPCGVPGRSSRTVRSVLGAGEARKRSGSLPENSTASGLISARCRKYHGHDRTDTLP